MCKSGKKNIDNNFGVLRVSFFTSYFLVGTTYCTQEVIQYPEIPRNEGFNQKMRIYNIFRLA